MDSKSITGNVSAPVTALQRAEAFSRALADAARRSRFSKRSKKRRLVAGGLGARRGEQTVRLLFIIGFVVLVIVPTLVGAIYFGFIASNQYETQVRFTIAGGEGSKLDGVGMLTGMPSLAVIQDTQIVANYIHSRALVDELERTINLRRMFSYPDIDRFSAFRPDRSIEKLVGYWKDMTSVSIEMPAGIVVAYVRAFRPTDAVTIAEAVLERSETLVNDMNERLRKDSLASAEQEFARASENLSRSRLAVEKARNVEGVLDAGETARAVNDMLTTIQTDRSRLQQEYDTQKRYVSEEAPQMRALRARLAAADVQIAELQAQLTTHNRSRNEPALSETMTRFSKLQLESTIAERQYANAAATLELARATAARKHVYLTSFVRPAIPEEPRYPKRLLNTLLVALAGVVVWGIGCGAVTMIRNNLA